MKNHQLRSSAPSNAGPAQLSLGWVESHTPAPGSERAYKPAPVDYDDSREGDFARREGESVLRQIGRATRDEQARLERSFR
jgi:hypothetical protein